MSKRKEPTLQTGENDGVDLIPENISAACPYTDSCSFFFHLFDRLQTSTNEDLSAILDEIPSLTEEMDEKRKSQLFSRGNTNPYNSRDRGTIRCSTREYHRLYYQC